MEPQADQWETSNSGPESISDNREVTRNHISVPKRGCPGTFLPLFEFRLNILDLIFRNISLSYERLDPGVAQGTPG